MKYKIVSSTLAGITKFEVWCKRSFFSRWEFMTFTDTIEYAEYVIENNARPKNREIRKTVDEYHGDGTKDYSRYVW